MTEIYTESYLKELWKTNKKDWFKAQFKRATQWVEEHSEVVLLGSMAASVLVSGLHEANKAQKAKAEEDHRDLDIYDHSLGIYYHLRRKPKPHEYGEITRRRKAGEDYYTILSSMRLL